MMAPLVGRLTVALLKTVARLPLLYVDQVMAAKRRPNPQKVSAHSGARRPGEGGAGTGQSAARSRRGHRR